MSTTELNNVIHISALDDERGRLNALALSISHSARELALTADIYSERIRHTPLFPERLREIEGHLAQLRRNAADAQYLAESARHQLSEDHFTWTSASSCDVTLSDAQVRLTLADLAYDRACD